jgi:hypothetical protein
MKPRFILINGVLINLNLVQSIERYKCQWNDTLITLKFYINGEKKEISVSHEKSVAINKLLERYTIEV